MTISFRRGQTIIVHLLDLDGLASQVASIVGSIRPVLELGAGVDPSSVPVATFAWAERPASESMDAGWTGTIDAATSQQIPEGAYAWDALLTLTSGIKVLTQTVEFDMLEPATVAS